MIKKDQDWIELIRSNKSAKKNDIEAEKVAAIKKAFLAHERRLGISNINSKRAYEKFISNNQSSKKGFFLNVEEIISRYKWQTINAIIGTASGFAIATLPVVTETVRGVSNNYAQNIYEFISKNNNTSQIDYIYKREFSDPQVSIRKITDLCLSAKVKIQIEVTEDNFYVYLFNLKAYSKEQAALKEMTEINQNIEGNIKISIGK